MAGWYSLEVGMPELQHSGHHSIFFFPMHLLSPLAVENGNVYYVKSQYNLNNPREETVWL